MKLNFDGIHLEKRYEYVGQDYALTVWGEYFDAIPQGLKLADFSIEEMQKLNFDGAYIAWYRDERGELVFRGHEDMLFMFYCVDGDTVFFSDNYYELVRKYKQVTWDLKAVSDYFEDAWNNIAKHDRTPLKEIRKFDIWSYLLLLPGTEEYQVGNWENVPKTKQYTARTMEAFKKELFDVMDRYLAKIHAAYDDIAIPVSAGTDANLLAARWSRLFPEEKTVFFTSKINDVTDESQIAACMQEVITSPIRYVTVNTEEKDLLALLRAYIDKYLPPRALIEISEQQFITALWENGIRGMHLSGMGADGQFGDFGGEYRQLMNEKLRRLHFVQAWNIYKAIAVSFTSDGGGTRLLILPVPA